jgi:SAM-dependent methyltransferase
MATPGHRYHCVYEHLSQRRAAKVLELGFGLPGLVEGLATLGDELTIIDIVDRTSGMPLPPNVRLEIANLDNAFPFADREFDVVIAMMVVEHLFDPFHAFSEIARVAADGGHVFVNLPNVASIKCRAQLALGRMPVTSSRDWFEKREWDGNHLHYFTVKDVIRLASLSGLRLTAMHPVGRVLPLKKLRPSLFCHEISYAFRKEP